jgi:penicillin amidase
MSNTDNALSVIYSGQSGHPTSPHYKDQTKLWLNGEYHTLPLSDEGVERITRRVLVLQPAE